ncbi:uncharacterized protein BT62DRAFT_1010618 [Guyanagaster necrorhizus]|uniref:Uncharacterized protein n=1 Tax=Guyanagaster necrorhizus TaxID=856835 RepID=A0A9P8APZ3_9AGAR|nr:uncharacterized protein BT62DRAFT_1010618 [Guyanagaster necrorhizus MCA 3950]KAG7442342.1 hypothetical protein BT62DRAFT_1010618 [Guyanagaster necrorhizus MCA 3950]
MHTNNPYAQAGWFNPDNADSINNTAWSPANPPQASIYGALPFPPPPTQQSAYSFTFSYRHSILNSTITGPNDRPYFRVVNDSPSQGKTVIQNHEGHNFTIIEWKSHPVVEIRELLDKQTVASWLPLSSDKTQRAMFARGKWYSWVPYENTICLFTATYGSTPPSPIAKILRGDRTVTLDITGQAIQIGLLEICIVATVLLQSERNID